MAGMLTLDRFYETLQVGALSDAESLKAFYYEGLNEVRGEDNVARLELDLGRSFGGRHFRHFLAGHSGCGKSTELSRLADKVKTRFRVIRFSAREEMHPSSAQPFDVLILMMLRLAEEIAKPVSLGGLAWTPPDRLAQSVLDWFAEEKITNTSKREINASVEAGAGIDGDSVWGKVLGLFGRLKGEVKFASQREKQLVERRFARLSDLIQLANDFFDVCGTELKERCGQEWLFLGEDFEKLVDSGIPKKFFVKESAVFSDLRTHLIFTIPVDLAWSAQGVSLPFLVRTILDTPVYTEDNQPDAGRNALRALLARRINLECFEPGQLDRLIVASGGHLRDLFSLINDAADRALLASATLIRRQDTTSAIAKLRQEVTLRLGESPYDPEKVTWGERVAKLKAIHAREPDARVPDAALHLLLRARAVQEFNGAGRFAVAPLVVDILFKQGHLAGDPGGLLPAEG